MQTKPVIGVLPLWDVDRTSLWMLTNYLEALRAAGGTPIVLTFDLDSQEIARIVAMCDGLLFTGGQDVHPSVYGEEDRTGRLIPCPKRDQLEVRVLQAALEADKPIFGICRGIQLINAALGGTLYQDLPTEHPSSIVHRQGKPYDIPSIPSNCRARWLHFSTKKQSSSTRSTTRPSRRWHPASNQWPTPPMDW